MRVSHEPLPAGGRGAIAVALAALLCGASYLAVEAYLAGGLGFPLDDSWIHLQFARSLAAGDGLAYNPGVPVAGSTAPLWTAILALLHALPGSVVVWTKLAGVAFTVVGVLATRAVALELRLDRALATLAALLVAATDALVWSALSGMEVPLFVALTMGGLLAHLRERRAPSRPPLALAIFAVATLARPEGLLLLTLALVDGALVWRRAPKPDDVPGGGELALARPRFSRLAAGLGLAALVLVPVAVALIWINGSPLPTTYGVKAGAALHAPSGRYLLTAVGVLLHPQPAMFLLAGAGAVALVRRLGTRADAGLLLALWPLALPVAYASMTPSGSPMVGNFGRYLYPLFPPLVLLGILGLAPAAAALGPTLRLAGRRLPLRALGFAALVVPTLLTLVSGAARYAQSVVNVEDSDVRLAHWLRQRVPATALVAVQDIGAVKYIAPQRVLDLSGIVHPAVRAAVAAAAGPADPTGAGGMLRFIAAHRPEYLAVYDDWYPRLTADRALFRPLLRIQIPGNITMASDELMVYATPWTGNAPPLPEPPSEAR